MSIKINKNNWIVITNDDPSYESMKDLLTIVEKELVVTKKYDADLNRRKTVNKTHTVAKYLYSIDKTNNDLLVPFGLLKYVKHLFKNSVIENYIDRTHPLYNTSKIVDNIENYRNVLPGICLYDNQLEAVKRIFQYKRGVIQAATGFGKTEIMCATIQIMKQLNNDKYPTVLVLEPTVELLKGIKSRFKTYKIPVNDYRDTRVIMSGKVNLAHPKSLCNDLKNNKKVLDKIEVQFADECIHGKSKILLPDNKLVSMEEVYENPYITEVMSYNFEKNIYEPKKILRKIRNDFNDKFWKLIYTNPVTNADEVLMCTDNHKIWTENRGYVRCDELTLNDIIKIDTNNNNRIYVCDKCGKEFTKGCSLGFHKSIHNNPNRVKELYEKGILKSSLSDKETHKKAMITRSNNENYRKYLSNRMKTNNPVFKEDVRKKIGESIKRKRKEDPEFLAKCLYNYKMAPYKNFKNKNYISSYEQLIINLNIPDLNYTGDGTKWVTFKNGKRKNPDFVYANEAKIIEIGDTEYWHTEEEIKDVIYQYSQIGYKCLYLTGKDVSKGKEYVEGKIRKFLFNHNIKIKEIIRPNYYGSKSQFRYNIEVEDNHNYYANGILVSNCHHVQSKTWAAPTYHMSNLIYSIGLSATFISHYHVNGQYIDDFTFDELKRIGNCGPIIMRVDGDELIDNNQLAYPKLCILHNKANEIIDETKIDYNWNNVRKIRLQSETRTKLIAKAACVFAKYGRKVIILMNILDWGRQILQYIHEEGYGDIARTCFGGQTYEKVNKKSGKIEKEYNSALKLFDKEKVKIIIGSSCIQEGLDLSKVDVCILAAGGKSDRTTLQSVGRALRRSKTGKYAYIVDFNDLQDDMLNKQFRERMIKYKKVLGISDSNDIIKNCNLEQLESKFKEWEDIQ